MVGRKTEKTRLKRSITKLQSTMRETRHWSLKDQAERINQVLRGHYAYYGIAGNLKSLYKLYRAIEKYWYKMLNSRCWKDKISWDKFHEIRARVPLLRPELSIPYDKLKMYAML